MNGLLLLKTSKISMKRAESDSNRLISFQYIYDCKNIYLTHPSTTENYSFKNEHIPGNYRKVVLGVVTKHVSQKVSGMTSPFSRKAITLRNYDVIIDD